MAGVKDKVVAIAGPSPTVVVIGSVPPLVFPFVSVCVITTVTVEPLGKPVTPIGLTVEEVGLNVVPPLVDQFVVVIPGLGDGVNEMLIEPVPVFVTTTFEGGKGIDAPLF